MDALSKLFQAIESRNGENNAATADDLRARLHGLLTPQTFKVGDVVRYKPGLKYTRFPGYEQNVIVTEVLSEPVMVKDKDANSCYFRRPLTL